MTLEEALKIAEDKDGYALCKNPSHGYGEDCVINGVTAPAKVVLCPIIQFYPRPILMFHSEEDFLLSSQEYFKRRGWI